LFHCNVLNSSESNAELVFEKTDEKRGNQKTPLGITGCHKSNSLTMIIVRCSFSKNQDEFANLYLSAQYMVQ